MNYHKIYNQLVEHCNKREEINGYTEMHHIIPRCLGGTDEGSNLVRMTAREHFVAHELLVKMYPLEYKLAFAFVSMCKPCKNLKGRKSTLYHWHRVRVSEAAKEYRKKQLADPEFMERWRKSMDNQKGKTGTETQKKAVSESNKKRWENRELELERMKRARENGMGQYIRKEHTCPHCNHTGKSPNIFRYHFTHCPNKL